MPITLTFTKGALPEGAEVLAAQRITQAFLKWHDLQGNTVMTPNVTGHVNILPEGSTFSGGEPISGAWIETKTPSFALADRDVQEGFFKEATEIIYALSGGTLPKERIWSNCVHTVDGTWNMDGQAMTNEELGERISRG